jgi:hypothetical protein
MGRLLFRNQLDNKWLDSCKHPFAVRSTDNRTWIPLDPRKTLMRDASDSDWIVNDCTTGGENSIFDEPCKFGQIQPLNCPVAIPLEEAGSGDGTGSGGLPFDLVTGYPVGYDLPDSDSTSFTLEKDPSAPKGYAIRRPGLNYLFESYDDSGTTPSYGRGNYDNPNYIGSSVFSGGCMITESIFDLRDRPGYVEILFASYDEVGISVDVYYLGSRVATTCGRVVGRSKIEFYYDPLLGDGEQRVMIRVRGGESTRWAYQVTEPKVSLSVYNLDNTDITQMARLFTDEYVGTPVYPAPCHSTVFPKAQRTADGKWFYEFHHWIGPIADPNMIWESVLDYTSWLNADKFEVYHGGLRIATSLDVKTGLGMLKFLWRPDRFGIPVTDLMVRVTAAGRQYDDDMESWYYSLYCPNTPGYRENPWVCGVPSSTITSMGYSSTEDNFDLDNGIDPGIVSLAFQGFEEGTVYVVSIFDANMDLIISQNVQGLDYVQFITNSEFHGDTRQRIAVRIDAPLGSSWEYDVACPAPMLDVYIDDKHVPICNDNVELTITDLFVPKGEIAKFRVSSNIPLDTPLTFDYETEDGTAKDASSFTGSGNIYTVDDAATAPNLMSFITYTLGTNLFIADSSFYRLADTEFRAGVNSGINEPVAATLVNQLVPEFRMMVNAWNIKLGNLNGKRWLILGDREANSGTDRGLWGNRISDFLQSMQNLYGMVITFVPFDVQGTSNSWESALMGAYDIVTISSSNDYSLNSNTSLSAVYESNQVSDLGNRLNAMFMAGTVIHSVLRTTTSFVLNQRCNALTKEFLNANPSIDVQYAPNKRLSRQAPQTAQYFVSDIVSAYPDTPLTAGIPGNLVIDADINQAHLTYMRKAPTETPADYSARQGTVSMLAGDTSAVVNVPTLNPTNYNIGRFFFLNLSNLSSGTFIRDRARATISLKDATIATLKFTKTAFSSYSYATADGSVLTTYGNEVELKIDSIQIAEGSTPEILQPGQIAYIERNGGSDTDARKASRQGICASYEYDSGKTYTYRWEVNVDYNDIGATPVVTGASESFSGNKSLKISVAAPLAVDPVRTLRATYRVILHVRDNTGATVKSQEVLVSMISAPVL